MSVLSWLSREAGKALRPLQDYIDLTPPRSSGNFRATNPQIRQRELSGYYGPRAQSLARPKPKFINSGAGRILGGVGGFTTDVVRQPLNLSYNVLGGASRATNKALGIKSEPNRVALQDQLGLRQWKTGKEAVGDIGGTVLVSAPILRAGGTALKVGSEILRGGGLGTSTALSENRNPTLTDVALPAAGGGVLRGAPAVLRGISVGARAAARGNAALGEVGAVGKLAPKPTQPPQVGKTAPALPPVKAPVRKAGQGSIDQRLEETILGPRGVVAYKERPLGKLAEKLSIDRQARKLTQPVERGADKLVRASLESGSRIARTPGRFVVGVSKQAGKSREELSRLGVYAGERQLGDVYGKSIAKSGEKAIQGGVRPEAVASALDPQLYTARGGKPLTLTSAEVRETSRLRKIMDITHEGNYKLGLLDKTRYKANKGTYFPRDMSKFFEDDPMRQIAKNNKMELNIFKPRKDLSDIPSEVIKAAETDPYFLTAMRVQQFQRNKAFVQYSDWLSKNGSISPAPKKGYVQIPDNKAYGSLAGKHVLKEQAEDLQGFIYETGVAQDIISLLNRYDRIGLRRARKAVLTIFNPGVRLGNRTFNNLIAGLNGINPITLNRNWVRGGKMMKSNSPEFLEATRAGIFSPSMIQKELYRTGDIVPKQNIAKRGIKIVGDTYQAVDDKAKMATYLTFRERGLPIAEAAERTRRMQQNYDLVGFMFDQGAKTPLIGNAFIRFSSELLRIAHNTAADNPIRLATSAVAATTLVNVASKMSGETPEDRKTREERLGAPRVPFTNQSLEIQSPWGAINLGRLLGLTTYNDLTGGLQEDVKRYLPWQIPLKKDETGIHLSPQAISADPLLGPFASLVANRDFRGKQIADPDAEKYPSQPLSKDEQKKNRLNYLGMSLLPYASDANSIKASLDKKENYYGQTRSLPQSLLRVGGVKVEQFGRKKAEEQRGRNEYFDGEFKDIEKFKRENPGLAPSLDKFLGREKDRKTGKILYDIVSPEKWKLVSADNSLKTYDFLRGKALNAHSRDKKPVDPIYKLPTEKQVRLVLELRSRPTGEDIEREEILRATQPWYTAFETAERAYGTANTEYFKKLGVKSSQGARAEAWNKIGIAKQPLLVERYFQLRDKNPDAAKAMFATTNLSAEFDVYTAARLKVINAKREIEGYDPISANQFDNVTFGYEEDERKVFNELKYGKGYGGYGSRSGRRSKTSSKKVSIPSTKVKLSLTKYGGGQSATAKVLAAAPKGGSKPKNKVRLKTKKRKSWKSLIA